MRVVRLELFHVDLPLKKPIQHASHTRESSPNFVVRVELAGGIRGHGEGVPRAYVTGETIDSCFEAIERAEVARVVGEPSCFEEVVERLEDWTLPGIEADPRGMNGNAARCAVELALLDAYGRGFGRSVGDVVRLSRAGRAYAEPSPRPVRYSGAITAAGRRKEVISAWKQRLYGFRQVKVKVGVPGQDDAARLARFRRILGNKVDIRIDANEAWSPSELAQKVAPLLASRPSVLEQPVPHEEVGKLAQLRPGLGVPLMLDESLCGYPDGERAVREGLTDFFNIRLSKCGGILPSLKLVDLARRSGLGLQLGCHPGESAILSAAGRAVAANLRGITYLEGSYDRHILRENLGTTDVTFGYGGRAKPLEGSGLGIEVDPLKLESLAVRRMEVPCG